MPLTYSQIYDRLQQEFSVEDLTPDAVVAWLMEGKDTSPHKIKYGFDKRGQQRYATGGVSSQGLSKIRAFAEGIGRAGEIMEEADTADTIAEIRQLRREASSLPVHQRTVTEFVQQREQELEIAERITLELEEEAEKLRQTQIEGEKLSRRLRFEREARAEIEAAKERKEKGESKR